MSDLHARILGELDRREAIARHVVEMIGDSPWVVEYLPTTQRVTNARAYVIAETHVGSPLPGHKALWAPEPEHIALHDPADALRRYARDRKVLKRHAPMEMVVDGKLLCAKCRDYAGHLEWPCPDVEDLAESLGIEAT